MAFDIQKPAEGRDRNGSILQTDSGEIGDCYLIRMSATGASARDDFSDFRGND